MGIDFQPMMAFCPFFSVHRKHGLGNATVTVCSWNQVRSIIFTSLKDQQVLMFSMFFLDCKHCLRKINPAQLRQNSVQTLVRIKQTKEHAELKNVNIPRCERHEKRKIDDFRK